MYKKLQDSINTAPGGFVWGFCVLFFALAEVCTVTIRIYFNNNC